MSFECKYFSWIKYTKFLKILFWLTNTLNNIVALFHKVVFVYKVNWIENELHGFIIMTRRNQSIRSCIFSFDKQMKMFGIVTYYYNCSLLFSNVFKHCKKLYDMPIFYENIFLGIRYFPVFLLRHFPPGCLWYPDL